MPNASNVLDSGGGGIGFTNKTIGLPCPIGHKDKASEESDKAMLASSFIIQLEPCDSVKANGINTLEYDNKFNEYSQAIKSNIGYNVPSEDNKTIKLAIVTEGGFSETFNNQLGDSFLTNMSTMLGSQFNDVRQMMGGDTLGNMLGNIGEMSTDQIKKLLNASSADATNMKQDIDKAAQQIKNASNRIEQHMPDSDVGSILVGMLTGNKIDFPKLWKASSMTANYSFTVRLYCPNPDNDDLFMERIVGPLASLVALALPRTRDDNTYYWPYYTKVIVPGNLDVLTMLTSVSVIKGGDSRAWNISQKPYIVDVRISFAHLYNAMLLPIEGKPSKRINGAPYIDTYVDSMKSAAEFKEKTSKTSFKLSPKSSRGSGGPGGDVGDGQGG